MATHLFLFPDTNVFVQCKPLEQVDWSDYAQWDSVDLYLTRPVQSEVDAQKSKGSGRLAKRARAVSSLIRSLLESEAGFVQVQGRKPTVRLFLKHELKKDETLADELDYAERDDQLVGIASGFLKNNPDADVRVLTHDTGPMASAKLVGLPYDAVPDTWLLPPEANDDEKRSKAIDDELMRYKRAEPNFRIALSDKTSFLRDGAVLTSEIKRFTALDDMQILGFIGRLGKRYPVAEDFGSRERAERTPKADLPTILFGVSRETFEPATDAEIADYRTRHAEWLSECKAKLRDLHDLLNAQIVWPTLSIEIENDGSRPAEDALVVFETDDQLQLMPIYSDKDGEPPPEPDFPTSPVAPQGVWKKSRGFHNALAMAQFLPTSLGRDIDLAGLGLGPQRRDPNGFYWKPSRPQHPCIRIEMECAQWRHMVAAESFDFYVRARLQARTATSRLVTKIHAANLTNTAQMRYVLRIVVTEISAAEAAEDLVSGLDA